MTHAYPLKLVTVVLICGGLLLSAFVSSAGSNGQSAERFEGDCEMSGVIRHRPAMTLQPRQTKVRGHFAGVCTGKLTDRRGRTRSVTEALARYEARGAGELSCLGGTAPGTGKLIFARGRQISFRLTERRTPGLAVVRLRGAAGGSATVRGTARSEDLPSISERCNGSGVRLLRGDARITSLGISG